MATTEQRVVAGPGIVQPGMHIEYLPTFRPGPRSKHCHGGTILSIGSKTVRWLPYGWHCPVRTPLTAMRIDVGMHIDKEATRQAIRAGHSTSSTPQWCVWSLAQHLDYAVAHIAPSSKNPTFRGNDPMPDAERPLRAPGIVEPGWHIEYLPSFRPRPRPRHALGGTIVSVGSKVVRWRPHGSHTVVCSPLEHMRISPEHIPTPTVLSNALAGRQPQDWYAWSLAKHLMHTAKRPSSPDAHGNAAVRCATMTASATQTRGARDVCPGANKQLSLFSAEEVPRQRPKPATPHLRSNPPRTDGTTGRITPRTAANTPPSSPAVTPAPPSAHRPVAEPIVVIPCGASKLGVAAEAGNLYTGSYHKACRATAEALTAGGGTVLVLSARYGLLPLDQVIEPYDLRMGQPGSITAEQLRTQARALGIDGAKDVTVLAGAVYTAAARHIWSNATAPLIGLGIGRQLQTLVRLRTPATAASVRKPPVRPEHGPIRAPFALAQSTDMSISLLRA